MTSSSVICVFEKREVSNSAKQQIRPPIKNALRQSSRMGEEGENRFAIFEYSSFETDTVDHFP